MKEDEFIKIIKENQRILYKVIYSYCKETEDRKDLEQEIIIQLWNSIDNYNSNYKLSTWLYKVALNVAISHYRKDSKRIKKTEPINDSIFRITDDSNETDLLSERTDLLYTFIGQLSKLNKAIIILHLEDNNYGEIAEIMGMTESNVGTKINRIKKELRENFTNVN